MPLPFERRTNPPQFLPAFLVVGHDPSEAPPEPGAVIGVNDVDDFVGEHVVDERRRCLDDPPVHASVPAASQLAQRFCWSRTSTPGAGRPSFFAHGTARGGMRARARAPYQSISAALA
jgi:hypothetical protein